MGYSRRYSRRRYHGSNSLGSVVYDAARTASGLSPNGALILGVLGFLFFYFVIPWGLEAWIEHSKANLSAGVTGRAMAQMLDTIFTRRFIHPSELAGIAILLVSSGIAVWKAYTAESLTMSQSRDAGWFAKLIARLLG